MFTHRRATLFTAVLLLGLSSARASLVSVDWAPDASANGLASGTIAGLGFTLTSTDGPANGGVTFGTAWNTVLATNDVPGVNDPGFVYEAATIDWNPGAAGSVAIAFIGGTVRDPILFFNFLDLSVQTFDFDDALTITILDQNPAGSISLAPGNVVTTIGGFANTANDGFAVQLNGTFSSLTFATNTNLDAVTNSVGFTIAIPEPSSLLSLAAAAGLFTLRRRRQWKSPSAGEV